ncbi:hypothetical protein D778_01408 [Xanthomarina gelatinilytica]|uniref:Uncharacterized protein n=1 Tax=Xanthomarina gelatinilytica TaxID=1137281 RepID=M7MFI0_9FLAO|nr:hypothetical protein D778_01408 [Xanthomarina gelatinilytica]
MVYDVLLLTISETSWARLFGFGIFLLITLFYFIVCSFFPLMKKRTKKI